MNMFVVVLALVPLVMGADPDPTTFCAPKKFSFTSALLYTSKLYRVHEDWEANKISRVLFSGISGMTVASRKVIDMNKKIEYEIKSGLCNSRAANYAVGSRCLPASAQYIGPFYEGLVTNYTLQIFQLTPKANSSITFLMARDPNVGSYPLLVDVVEDGKQVDVVFNANPAVGFGNHSSVFDIPDPCPMSI